VTSQSRSQVDGLQSLHLYAQGTVVAQAKARLHLAYASALLRTSACFLCRRIYSPPPRSAAGDARLTLLTIDYVQVAMSVALAVLPEFGEPFGRKGVSYA
jgi:hypothetical protein